MRATTFWWYQRKLDCFVTRCAVPRDFAVTCVVWVCSVLADFLSFCYSLRRVRRSGLRSPGSPVAYSYVPHRCTLCPSALVPSCHMASPFPLQTPCLCHDVLRIGSVPATCHSIDDVAFHIDSDRNSPFRRNPVVTPFIEREVSSPYSQNPTTGSHSEWGGTGDKVGAHNCEVTEVFRSRVRCVASFIAWCVAGAVSKQVSLTNTVPACNY